MIARLISALLPLIAAALLWTTPAAAQSPSTEIQSTITSQITAFQADDFAQAFTYASPNIQRMFGNPTNFGAMVRNGYPMVWRPQSYRFGDLREIAGALWQVVIIQDQAGDLHALDYRMVQIDGVWRISAVQILQTPELSA